MSNNRSERKSPGEAAETANESGDRRAFTRCHFCGRGQDKVRKMVAGPGTYICDECIDLNWEVIHAGDEEGHHRQRLKEAIWRVQGLVTKGRLAGFRLRIIDAELRLLAEALGVQALRPVEPGAERC